MSKPLILGTCTFCFLPVLKGTPYTCCMCEGGCDHSVAHQCCVELAEAQDAELCREVGLIPEADRVTIQ